jgi:hypothetical protein
MASESCSLCMCVVAVCVYLGVFVCVFMGMRRCVLGAGDKWLLTQAMVAHAHLGAGVGMSVKRLCLCVHVCDLCSGVMWTSRRLSVSLPVSVLACVYSRVCEHACVCLYV